MPTALRVAGYRIVIFTDDHLPAHVHAVSGIARAKIALGSADESPSVIEVEGINKNDMRKIFAAVCENQDVLLAKWREIHG